MAIGRMIIVIIGLILFFYGGGALLKSQFTEMDTTLEWYKNVFMCMISGGGLSFVGIYSQKVVDIIKDFGNNLPKKQKIKLDSPKEIIMADEKKIDTSSWTFLMENYDHLDGLAHQLETPADKELCRQLQKRLLDIHHEFILKKNEKTT